MNKFLKISGFIALGLGFLAIILMIATNAITLGNYGGKGADVLFGKNPMKAAVLPLIGWIILIIATLVLGVNAILALMKKDTLKKHQTPIFAALALLFVLAAVFTFLTVTSFVSANGGMDPGYKLGAGWVIAAILAIGAAALCGMKAFIKEK